MDGCLSPLAVELHAKLATGFEEEEEEGRRELGVERDWAREQRMKERVQTTRGLLLHLPGSCRFNDDISYSSDDWNTYVRAKKSFKARFDTELSFVEGDVITVMVDAEDMWSRSTWWCGMLRGRKGLFATENVESFNQENYDCLCEFLEDQFCGEELTELRALAMRQVEEAPDPAGLLWECVQCPQLTELDLKGCHLVELCDELQFWAVPNLTVLNLSNTQLPYLPASVGRLKHLNSLMLQGNALTTLPSTISFCSSLASLDLQNNNFSILPAVIFRIESLKTLQRHGNYDMRKVIGELAASTRKDQYVTVVQERLSLLLSSGDRQQVVPLKLLAVQAVMTGQVDYWAHGEVAPALCRVLDVSQNEYKICDNCCSAKPLDMRGFRIRWLLESYLGLKHVPFEHFACCSACARTLNDSFQSIQSRLKQQHDREYQTMLEKYADMEPAGRPRHWSLFRKARKELEVRELWCTDFGQPTAGRRRAWTAATVGTGGRAASTWRSRHPHHHHHHRRHHHRSSRSGCTLM